MVEMTVLLIFSGNATPTVPNKASTVALDPIRGVLVVVAVLVVLVLVVLVAPITGIHPVLLQTWVKLHVFLVKTGMVSSD
jgi:hypothetical protein